MTFIPKEAADSNFALRFYKKTATTEYALNSLVAWVASQTGYVIPATSSTTNHIGTILKKISTTDSDYGDNTLVPILVPTKGVNSIWVATTTGTAVATDVGGNFDLSDAVTVNRAAESVGAFTMTGFRSATLTEGYLRIPTSTT